MSLKSMIVGCAVASAVSFAFATTRYVPADGDLATVVGLAQDDDVVEIAAGTYAIPAGMVIDRNITIAGAGMTKTILTGNGMTGSRMFKANGKVTFRDFKIDGIVPAAATAGESHGVAFFLESGSTISNVWVNGVDCSGKSAAWDACGVEMHWSSRVSRCIFSNCTASKSTSADSSAIRLENDGFVDNCLFYNNKGKRYGCAIWNKKGILVNCTVYGNSCTGGGDSGGGIWLQTSDAKAYNCVCYGNTATGDATGYPDLRAASAASVINCATPQGLGTDAVTLATPGFANPEQGDFTLLGNSQLINKGTTPSIKNFTMPGIDLAGQARVLEDIIEIGAYEYNPNRVTVALEASPRQALAGATFSFVSTIKNLDETGATYLWQVTDASASVVATSTEKAFQAPLSAGRYSVRFSVLKGGSEIAHDEKLGYLNVGPRTAYLVEATPENIARARYPFDTPLTAHTNLNELIGYMLDGSEIAIGEGFHNLTNTVTTEKGVSFIGKGPDKTFLRRQPGLAASNRFGLLSVNHPDTVISNLTITGAILEQTPGSALTIGALGGLLVDCVVSNNTINGYGGGSSATVVLQGPKAIVERCVIAENSVNSDDGCGGVYVNNGELRNSLIRDNQGKWISMAGGVKVSSKGRVVNCTIVGNSNTASPSADRSYYTCGIILVNMTDGGGVVNTICHGNSDDGTRYDFAPGYPDWFVNGTPPAGAVSNCCFGTTVTGVNSFVADPLFVDASAKDYHLTSASPAVNRGLMLNHTAESLDLDKNPRVYGFGHRGRRPDLGCYESEYGDKGLMILMR